MQSPTRLQDIIALTLRTGVTLACAIALVGGIIYIVQHGSEPMPDYSHFSYDALPPGFEAYTTLNGILAGVRSFTATGWIQLGVLVLLLTPILRVTLSLVDFLRQHDWLYAAITAVVLSIIIVNSL